MQYIRSKGIAVILCMVVFLLLASCGNDNQNAEKKEESDVTVDVTAQQSSTEAAGFSWPSVGEVSAVAAGNGYSLLLNVNHDLYAWGSNSDYVLGRYGVVSLSPEIVISDVIDMSAGSSHAGAIKADYSLWLWGNNDDSQLGKAALKNSAEPISVMTDVDDVICADRFTVVLRQDGTVWTFGRNHAGQLGNGSTDAVAEPVEVLQGVIKVAAGNSFVMALKSDGTLWGWGISNNGQLFGISNSSTEAAGQAIKVQTVPVKLMENIKDVACGDAHTLALDKEGTLYTWGLNTAGQLGNNGEGTWVDVNYGGKRLVDAEPNPVMPDVQYIAGGGDNSAAIKTDGTLWLWGSNANFQIGDGTSSGAPVPVQIMNDVQSVSLSYSHVMALKNDHSYYAWGSNENNALGDGNATLIHEPFKIMDNVKSASVYSDHTLVVTNNNELYAIGDNSMGQLATGDFLNTSVPTLVMHDAVKAAAGAQHSVCLKTDGSVWTWGSNALGQIGNGHKEDVNSVFDVWRGGHPVWADASGAETDSVSPAAYQPTKILENAIEIYANWHTSYAVLSNSTLYGWGWNELYQLGDDSRSSSASPIAMMEQVKTLVPSYALIKNDSTMWTWGSNSTDPYHILPMQAFDHVESAAVLDMMFLAVKDDHTLWVWGQSVPGALINEDGYFNTVETPVQIGSNVKKVFAHNNNIFVIDTNDTLWALDSNDIAVKKASSEQSDVMTYATEVMVMEDASEVYAGLESVLILKNDGSLWGYGSNESGQLGNKLRYFTPQHINK